MNYLWIVSTLELVSKRIDIVILSLLFIRVILRFSPDDEHHKKLLISAWTSSLDFEPSRPRWCPAMAPKPNLWLQDPFDAEDADIGDLSTGLSVLSNTSSSFTVPSTSKTNTSTTYNAYTPVEPVLSASSDFDLGTPPARPTLARKASLGQLVLASPSSPELVRSGLGTGPLNRRLSRSATLPRLSQLGSPHVSKGRKAIPEFTSLDVDEDVKDKIRRWILGIAIGVFHRYARR